jgi:thiol-disulfide isomerase/thioredoxin
MDAIIWQAGLTLAQFVEGMTTYQDEMRRRLREVALSDADYAELACLTRPVHALVMTEDWCPDCLMNVPILARVVEAAPGMDMRIFVRSRFPDLKAYYQARGVGCIPIFTFLDAGFDEIGTWLERSQAAHARLQEWKAARPEFNPTHGDSRLARREHGARRRAQLQGLPLEMERWYAEGLQAETVKELKALLAEANR